MPASYDIFKAMDYQITYYTWATVIKSNRMSRFWQHCCRSVLLSKENRAMLKCFNKDVIYCSKLYYLPLFVAQATNRYNTHTICPVRDRSSGRSLLGSRVKLWARSKTQAFQKTIHACVMSSCFKCKLLDSNNKLRQIIQIQSFIYTPWESDWLIPSTP